jgi:hypothetical protein
VCLAQNNPPDVIYEHDAHGAPVVRGGDGPESLLTRRVPYLQFDLLPVQLNRPYFEINTCNTSAKINYFQRAGNI